MAKRINELDRIEKGTIATLEIETSHSRDIRSSDETDIGLRQKPNSDEPDVQIPSAQTWIRRVGQSLFDLFVRPAAEADPASIPRDTIIRRLKTCPRGYPRLAAFLDSDENFMLYRRFGFVQARLLLYKQDQMRELEERLDNEDKIAALNNEKWLYWREGSESNDRKDFMKQLEERFSEYVTLLTNARDLASFNQPFPRDYIDVKRFFDTEKPLCHKEAFIYHKEDIVALRPVREKAWLDSFIESTLTKLYGRSVRYIFSSEDWTSKTDETGVLLFSRTRINNVVSIIITILILALFIIPIYILWFLSQGNVTNARVALIIGLLLIFTLLFCCVLWLTTRAKRQEILAAAAAYCAVLVVFIGNVGKLSS